MKATLEQFTRLCTDLGDGGAGVTRIFESVQARYSEPRRAYHTLEHVGWGLRRIDEMVEVEKSRGSQFDVEGWNLVRWAMWFHDVVLDGRPDDEEASADAACIALRNIGVHGERHQTVRRLILATAHDRVPLREDEAALCDCDLSILGAEDAAFDHYEELVRKEWEHVPLHLFAAARSVILKRFADRPWIYMTQFGRQRWELRARKNLARSLESLKEKAKAGEK